MLYKIALICLLCAAIAHSFSIAGYTCEYKLGATYPLGLVRTVRICRPTQTATASLLLNRIFNNAFEDSKESEQAQAINNYGALSQFRPAHDDRRFSSYEPSRAQAKINTELGVSLDTIKSDIHAIKESMSFMDLITQRLFGFPERQQEKAEKPQAEQNEIMSKLEQFERQIEHLTKELDDMRSEINAPTTTPAAVVDSDEVSNEDVDRISAEHELERKWREIMDSIRMDNEEVGDMIITRDPGNVDDVEEQENDGDDDINDDNDANEDADIMTTASPYTFYETENAHDDDDVNDDDSQINNNGSDEVMHNHEGEGNDEHQDFDYIEHGWHGIVGSRSPEPEPEPETDDNDYDGNDHNEEYDEW